jgi:transposase
MTYQSNYLKSPSQQRGFFLTMQNEATHFPEKLNAIEQLWKAIAKHLKISPDRSTLSTIQPIYPASHLGFVCCENKQ